MFVMSTSDLNNTVMTLLLGVSIGIGAVYLLDKARSIKSAKSKNDDPNDEISLIGTAHPYTKEIIYAGCIYLDYNATTPIFPEVAKAMSPFLLTSFGNPSSPHVFAGPCREIIQKSRESVGILINAPNPSATVFFTSCGSESDNRAIDISLYHYKSLVKEGCPHVITCIIEHPAIILYLMHLEGQQLITLTVLPVDTEGFVSTAGVASHLTKSTALVTIMHSNNEVGTLQPIRDISIAIKNFNTVEGTNILLHSDGAQSIGKVPIDVQSLGVDLFTVVGHKFGASKGVAALYVKEGILRSPILIGGGQEMGLRAGTECVILIAGLGAASEVVHREADALLLHFLALKRILTEGLIEALKSKGSDFIRFNGPVRSNDPAAIASEISMLRMILNKQSGVGSSTDTYAADVASSVATAAVPSSSSSTAVALAPSSSSSSSCRRRPNTLLVEQLPNTVSVSFRGVRVHQLMPLLADKVACSAGSACHSHSDQLSPVLSAMGVHPEYGMGTLRLSLGRHTSELEIRKAVASISKAVLSLSQ